MPRSFTYLALNSPLVAVGFWTQLAAAMSIRVLEGQVVLGSELSTFLGKPPMKINRDKTEPIEADKTIAQTARELAWSGYSAVQAAARGVGEGADEATGNTIDDAAQHLDRMARTAAEAIAATADATERAIVRQQAADAAPNYVTTEGDLEIELRAERLVIDKQLRQHGEARVRKETVTEVISFEVPVSHEELVIEHYPATGDNDVNGEPIADETIGIPLTEEQVYVTKETVVGEEVEIGKIRIDDVEHISDTVRHEELVVVDGAATN